MIRPAETTADLVRLREYLEDKKLMAQGERDQIIVPGMEDKNVYHDAGYYDGIIKACNDTLEKVRAILRRLVNGG